MPEDQSLEDKMLEAIRQAHWQANPSESRIAARKCAIIAFEQIKETLKACMNQPINTNLSQNVLQFIEFYKGVISELENNP